MAQDSQSDIEHHTFLQLRIRQRQAGVWPPKVSVPLRAWACKYMSLCVACLQSFSVICLHPYFLSHLCSLALWLSQHEAETHCAGFILELTGECWHSGRKRKRKRGNDCVGSKLCCPQKCMLTLKLCICAIKFSLIHLSSMLVCVFLCAFTSQSDPKLIL